MTDKPKYQCPICGTYGDKAIDFIYVDDDTGIQIIVCVDCLISIIT